MLYIIIAIKGQTEILREMNFDLAIIIIIIKKENIIINFTNHHHILLNQLRVLNNPLAFDHSGLQRIPINAIYTLR